MNRNEYKCDKCGKIFQYIFQVLKHERLKHEKKVLSKRENLIKNNLLKCPLCANIFNNIL